jgi:hypothetical protein
MGRFEGFQNHTHQAIYVQHLYHVEFYIIVHDDDELCNYEHNHQHDNDLMLYSQTKIYKKMNGISRD